MEDHGLTAEEVPRVGPLANQRRVRLGAVHPELIRAAAARIAEPEPSAPTLVVAAFQSSI